MFTITDIRKQRAKAENRRQRLRKGLVWGGGSLVLLTLVVLFVVPPVLRSQLEVRLSKRLDRKVQVESARFNPLRASAVIKGLHIEDRDGVELLGWSRLYVNFNLLALLWGNVEFDEIALSGFAGRVLVQKDGSLSVADLLGQSASAKSEAQTGKGLALKISKLLIEGSKFTFEDRSRGETFVTYLGPLNISLNDFEVHPEKRALYEFTAVTEAGGRLGWKGRLGVSPFRSSGDFSISGIVLKKYAPYYRPLINFEVLDGKLSLEGNYDLEVAEEGPRFKFSSGKLGVSGLALAKPGTQEAFLGLASLGVTGLEIDSSTSKALLGEVALKGLQLSAVRAKDGRFDLERFFAPEGATTSRQSPPSGNASVSNPWIQQFRLARLRVNGAQFDLRDETPRRPALLSVRELGLSLDDVSLATGAEIAVELSAKVAGNGSVGAKGPLCISPLKSELQWTLDELPLSGFSPYLEQSVRARLVQGRISSQGKLQLVSDSSAGPEISLTGSVDLKQLALVDEANGEPLAGLEALSLTGIQFSQKGRSLGVEELVLRAPSLSASIGKDGVLNLAGLLREPASSAQGSPSVEARPGKTEQGFGLRLGRISIDGGKAFLSDQSVRPEVRFSVRDFGGQINGLDTAANNPAKLALSGNLEGSGKVLLEGVLYPFGKQAATDLKFAVEGLNLVAFSSYSGKYAGYGLSSGRLGLDIKLKLEDRKLESSNVLTLDHFTFGEAVNSPDATKLPVRLAVALLKDRQGRILVDLPVSGSLDDPQFKVSGVVWHVIGNLLSKAATSPFALLGAAFGGGDELSQIDFVPGAVVLTAEAQKRFGTLQKALVDRPGLGVSLVGNFDLSNDVSALRTQHLDQLIARAVWQARVSANPGAATVAESAVTAQEREQTLRALYAVNHPGTLVQAPAAPVAQARSSKESTKVSSPGFFSRVYSFFFSGSKSSTNKQAPSVPAATPAPGKPVIQPGVPELSTGQLVAILEADLSIGEADLTRLALDRAQLLERTLQEAGVEAKRLSVSAPAAGQARVELQLR